MPELVDTGSIQQWLRDSSGPPSPTLLENQSLFQLENIPNEIFIEIIGVVLALEEYEQGRWLFQGPLQTTLHIRRLYQLATVSKWWADVINGAPLLWNLIHSQYPRDVIAAIVEKSETLPLTIMGEVKPDPAFVDTALSLLHRWSTTHLILSNPDDFINLGTSSAPSTLTHLTIGCKPRASDSYDLFGGISPQLKHLHLINIVVPPKSGLLSTSLTTLELSGVRGWALSAKAILNVLACTPNLSKLIVIPGGDVAQDVGTTRIPRVHLHQLRRLALLSMNIHPALVIHAAIVAPSCTSRWIVGPDYPDRTAFSLDPTPESPSNIPDAWIAQLGLHYPETLTHGRFTLDVRDNYLCWSANTGHPEGSSIVFLVHHPNPGAILYWITRTWNPKWAQVPFVLRVGRGYTSGHSLRGAMRRLPGLTAIKSRAHPTKIFDCIRMLARPRVLDQGEEPRWPCPSLETIDIRISSPTLKAMEYQLERRYGAVVASSGPHRVPLKQLKLQTIEKDPKYAIDRMGQIAMILGSDCKVSLQGHNGRTLWESMSPNAEAVGDAWDSDASASGRSSQSTPGYSSEDDSFDDDHILGHTGDAGEDIEEGNAPL